jgi:hypothetical protein
VLRHHQGVVELRVAEQLTLHRHERFASFVVERATAREITLRAEASSLLSQCEYSRRRSTASEKADSGDEISIFWAITHYHWISPVNFLKERINLNLLDYSPIRLRTISQLDHSPIER